jgi:hypothetical protein
MARYLSRETEPFGKWKGIPIYLTTIVCAVMVLGLLICTIAQVMGLYGLMEMLVFYVPRPDFKNLAGVFAYPLISEFNFFTPFAIVFMYSMSVGIETHLGRQVLGKLYLVLIFLPAAIATALAYGMDVRGVLAGNVYIACGVVIAFATLYPNAEWWAGIPFKFVAIACVFCGMLMALAEKKVIPVLALLGNCTAAFFLIRAALEQEYDDHAPFLARFREMFRRKPKFRVVPKNEPRNSSGLDETAAGNEAVSEEVDAILDKVARTGLQSLTSAEHAKLQKAREELQRRDRR